MKKSKLDDWNSLPKNVRTKIFGNLDPGSKLNLSLCSRRTWNNLVGRCDYFEKLKIKHINDRFSRREYYLIQMFYEHVENEIKENSEESYDSDDSEDDSDDSEDDDDDDDDDDDENEPEHYIEVDMHIEYPSEDDENGVKTICTRTIEGGESFIKDEKEENQWICGPRPSEIHTNSSGDPQTVAFRHFKRILKKNHRFLRAIDMDVAFMRPSMFHSKKFAAEIGTFTSLEYLRLRSIFTTEFFIPRISEKLKVLNLSCFEACLNNKYLRFVMDSPHFYEIPDFLAIKYTDIRYEEFIRLKAKNVEFGLGLISDQELNQFIHSWVNGEIRQELQMCVLESDGKRSEVDVNTVLNGLDVVEMREKDFNLGGSAIIHSPGHCETFKHFFGIELKDPKIYRTRSKSDAKTYMDIIFTKNKLVFAVRHEKDEENPMDME